MKKNSLSIFVPAVITTALWGSAVPAVKTGYALFSITTPAQRLAFAGVRFTAAGLIVLLLALLRCRSVRALVPGSARVWRGILALSASQTVMQYIFYYLGLAHTTGVKGSVLSATSTFFSVVIAHFFYASDRITLRRAAGCLLGFAGVVLVVSGGGGGFGGGFHLTGEGFLLLSAIGQGVGAVISKRVTCDPMQLTGWQLSIGGLALLLSGALMGGLSFQITPAGLLLLAYMAGLSSVAFTLWTMLLQKHPVSKVTVYSFLIPVFGAALSGVFLHENVFTARNLGALVLVAAGITIVNTAQAAAK